MVELCTRRTTERVRVGNSPPKVARAAFLSQPPSRSFQKDIQFGDILYPF